MNVVRRLSIAALCVACLHLVFGAIVRISGSGMGCGDNWPKCYGYWIPPFNRPDLIVEVSHRYLASILTLTVLSLAFFAFKNRREPGVSGRGGPMRSAFGAVGAVFTAAILGGVTVKMGNAPWATVAHWLVAMTLLAMVAMTAMRAGALGGASAKIQRGTNRAKRSGFGAALLAIFAVALGGLTAKYPGAAVGCTTVPMCGANPSVEPAGVHIQLTHRTIAVMLVLHLIGMVMMLRKRRAEEAPVVVKAAYIAFGMVVLQLVVASSMILFHLPPVLRSLHEATGVGIWLSCFALAYLARRAANVESAPPAVIVSPSVPPVPARELERDGGPAVASAPVTSAMVTSAMEAEAPHSERSEESPVEEAAPAQTHSERSEESPVTIEAPAIEVLVAESEISTPEEDSIVDAPIAAIEVADTIDREAVLEELDWEPKRAKADAEELDEFSIAAIEAEMAALEVEAKTEALVEDILELAPEPVVEAKVIERVAGESNLVAPPVEAPKLSPLPPAPTMAVLVARGADML